MPYVVTACRVLLLAVFAVSVWSKCRSRAAFTEFAASLVALRLAPGEWARRIAGAVLAAEALTVLLLAAAPATPGFGAAAALLCVLSGGVLVALRRRVTASCRCFGTSNARLGPAHLVRNLGLLAAAGTGLVAGPSGAGHLAGLLVAGAAGVVAAALVVTADDLAELFNQIGT